MSYFADHWKGRQGLAWSFWVNLVLLRLIVTGVQEWLAPAKGQDFSDIRWLVVLIALVFHGLLFVWQAVGVLRAGEAHLRHTGAMAPVWGVQAGTITGFFLALIYGLGAWQMTLVVPDDSAIFVEIEAERASRYTLGIGADGQTLMLEGSLELGITRAADRILAANPGLRRVILNSPGGNIYEARGLAQKFRARGLTTIVTDECSSACTTAFIGGTKRLIAPGARLGFHEYRVDADYEVPLADPASEQRRDRALFAGAGVAVWFLDRMHGASPEEMWFPPRDQLFASRVATGAYVLP